MDYGEARKEGKIAWSKNNIKEKISQKEKGYKKQGIGADYRREPKH